MRRHIRRPRSNMMRVVRPTGKAPRPSGQVKPLSVELAGLVIIDNVGGLEERWNRRRVSLEVDSTCGLETPNEMEGQKHRKLGEIQGLQIILPLP